MEKYALIRDHKILKFRNIRDNDKVITPKLLAHKYLPVVEQSAPAYDYITQTLTDSYEIQVDKVMRKWAIKEIPFTEAQQNKKNSVELVAMDKIRLAFDDAEQTSKVNKALNDKDSANLAIAAATNNTELRAIKME